MKTIPCDWSPKDQKGNTWASAKARSDESHPTDQVGDAVKRVDKGQNQKDEKDFDAEFNLWTGHGGRM